MEVGILHIYKVLKIFQKKLNLLLMGNLTRKNFQTKQRLKKRLKTMRIFLEEEIELKKFRLMKVTQITY